MRCEAGAAWDDVVAFAVSEGLEGIEALAGVPGMIGSACMQNIGAYGQEMGSALVSATLMDRATGEMRVWHADELGLGYRTSMLRRSMEGRGEGAGCGSSRGSSGQPARAWFPSPRWIVLDATLGLRRSDVGTLGHSQLAHALGVEVGTSMPVAQIRQTVLEVRAKKAMLAEGLCDAADAHDYDRWSTGSFFMNPVLSEEAAETLPADAPRYPRHRRRQDLGGLAHRARRIPARLWRTRCGQPCDALDQALPCAHQPRARDGRRCDRARPPRARRRARGLRRDARSRDRARWVRDLNLRSAAHPSLRAQQSAPLKNVELGLVESR